jgi:hypothetical protein
MVKGLDELSQTQPRAGRNLTDADAQRRPVRIGGAKFRSAAAGGNRERYRETSRDESFAPVHPPYFLFIGGSSIHSPQYALGFMLVAFLTILIFIIVS